MAGRVPFPLEIVLEGIQTVKLPCIYGVYCSWVVHEICRAHDGQQARICFDERCDINLTIQFNYGAHTPGFFVASFEIYVSDT